MLNLTTDQQAKIRPILDNESAADADAASGHTMSREDKMTKMRSIRENSMSQITPILTSEQQTEVASDAIATHAGTRWRNDTGAGTASAAVIKQTSGFV